MGLLGSNYLYLYYCKFSLGTTTTCTTVLFSLVIDDDSINDPGFRIQA
jgi:hypothetical protein